jgi:hypothetical protein
MSAPPYASGIPLDPEDSRYALSFPPAEAEGAKNFFEEYGYVVMN